MKNVDNLIYEKYTSTSLLIEKSEIFNTLTSNAKSFMNLYGSYLPKSKDAAILDIGCGFGKNIYTLVENDYKNLLGIDVSPEQVEYAHFELKLSSFVKQGDAINWLTQDTTAYDCILLIDVLEHFELSEALELGKLISARLKIGGSIIIQVPNGLAPLQPFLWGDLTHKRAFTKDSLLQYMRLIGHFECNVFEILPAGVDFKEGVRRIFWKYIFRPCIATGMRLMYGGEFGGIYTANLGLVAMKKVST